MKLAALALAGALAAPAVASAMPEPAPAGPPAPAVPAVTASVAPSDADSGTRPLKEIGRVRATTPLCRAMLEHATVAIDVALDNDRKIAYASRTLRTLDFDKSALAKAKGSQELTRQYVALRAAAVTGMAEARAVRNLAKDAPTDDQRAKLISFAEALEGAIYRQKKLAVDISRFIAFLDTHETLTPEDQEEQRVRILADMSNTRTVHAESGDDNDLVPRTLTQIARTGSDQIDERAKPILEDEDAAADRIEPAFAGC